jgi:CheY-like chemotaxis protein
MMQGPIIIVDDDQDDQEIYEMGLKSLGITNEIIFFDGGQKALDYLSNTSDQPFLIISDINMPQMNGIQFKTKIHEDSYLREKSIPFVFITTNATNSAVRQAHLLSVQGYFEKPYTMEGVKIVLKLLFDYWTLCKHLHNT